MFLLENYEGTDELFTHPLLTLVKTTDLYRQIASDKNKKTIICRHHFTTFITAFNNPIIFFS